MSENSRRWVLVLGASSGFGEATARAFAREGYDVIGVHLDRRATLGHVAELIADLRSYGREVVFFNENAASDQTRQAMIASIRDTLAVNGGKVRVLLHSLAFGTLKAYIAEDGGVSRKQLEMTLDVMANSLVYWVQDLVAADLLAEGGRVFALTSTGGHAAWAEYGPVSAAKAALEAHVRQLCLELAPRRITVNAILAGVTRTPALEKIPGAERIVEKALAKNPHHRLTVPADVAEALLALSDPRAYWITGNTIRVDGGEDFCA